MTETFTEMYKEMMDDSVRKLGIPTSLFRAVTLWDRLKGIDIDYQSEDEWNHIYWMTDDQRKYCVHRGWSDPDEIDDSLDDDPANESELQPAAALPSTRSPDVSDGEGDHPGQVMIRGVWRPFPYPNRRRIA